MLMPLWKILCLCLRMALRCLQPAAHPVLRAVRTSVGRLVILLICTGGWAFQLFSTVSAFLIPFCCNTAGVCGRHASSCNGGTAHRVRISSRRGESLALVQVADKMGDHGGHFV